MMGQLAAHGHELTPRPDQAGVIVVNTCSFIDPAKKESVDAIFEMAEYKQIGRALAVEMIDLQFRPALRSLIESKGAAE